MKLNELLDTLSWIALYKSMLPVNLRGWVNALGLYVQEREAGRWTRLQAGGRFRSCLDAWCQDDSDWQVRKLNKDAWKRSFAHLVEPTYDIVNFLNERVTHLGDLDSEGANALNKALQHYKHTGIWLGLPKVPDDVIHRLADEKTRARVQKERQKILDRIIDNEKRVNDNPLDRLAWGCLPFLYYQVQRYKDMEKALKRELTVCGPNWITYQELGKTYLSALSVSIRGKGIPVWGYPPSNITAEVLGYDIEELRALAKENLSKAYEMMKQSGFEGEDLTELDLALKAAESLSVQAFEEFDKYKERKNQEESN